jgi:FkbM family methyltransferase
MTIIFKKIKKIEYLFSIPSLIYSEPSNEGEKFKRIIMSIAWQFWKRLGMPPIISTLDNGKYFVLDPKSGNSAGAIYTKIYSSKHINFVRKNMYIGGTMIDVGAHAGLYTLLLAHLIKNVILFEPAPDTIKLLRRNMQLNDINARIETSAVGKESCQGFFTITGINSATNFIGQKGIPVSIVALDEILCDIKDLSFLKIDVEGGENDVITGAKNLLKLNPYAIVQIEITGDREPIVEILLQSGFKIYGFNELGNPQKYNKKIHISDDLIACGPRHSFTI